MTFQYHIVPMAVAEEMALIRELYYKVAEAPSHCASPAAHCGSPAPPLLAAAGARRHWVSRPAAGAHARLGVGRWCGEPRALPGGVLPRDGRVARGGRTQPVEKAVGISYTRVQLSTGAT
jgi:hypothetical protein